MGLGALVVGNDGKMRHWIGFVGKIFSGDHGFYHEIWDKMEALR